MEGSSLLVDKVKIGKECQQLEESQQYIFHNLDVNSYICKILLCTADVVVCGSHYAFIGFFRECLTIQARVWRHCWICLINSSTSLQCLQWHFHETSGDHSCLHAFWLQVG
jgi:hypothetical protein